MFKASTRVQSLLTRLDILRDDVDRVEPIGIPRVYHEPEIVRPEVIVPKPSAAKEPGIGILGIDVRTVRRIGSYIMSYIVCPAVLSLVPPMVVVLLSPIASAMRSATFPGSVEASNGFCSGPSRWWMLR